MPSVLFKSVDGSLLFHVDIGPSEAGAIIMALKEITPPRPLTHDFITHLFKKHKFTLEKVILCKKEKIIASLRYRFGFRKYSEELRPSDAIALAVRSRCPIYLSEELKSTAIAEQKNLDINLSSFLSLKHEI